MNCICGTPGHHSMDGVQYCCTCFDSLVEHGGNIKMDLAKLARISELSRTWKRLVKSADRTKAISNRTRQRVERER